MDKLLSFISRLEREQLRYRLDKSPDGLSIRIQIDVEPEYWVVDFSSDEEIEIEVYEYVRDAKYEDLNALFDRLAKSWMQAASDLNIEFVSPYNFTDQSGYKYSCAGLVKYFGSSKGTLIISRKDSDDVFDGGIRMGFNTSGLNPRYYEKYDRERFIQTLREWGWYGKERSKPNWF